ncbi:hypothetical protein NEMIN01_0658 [Nematocida minor]|uniref:uncharacterized protein n=1 Tax=Nematocida minor TaxID=1912983 RepID=UPI002220589B|nr:uncharacterized protein NEMIN01_0658 [Nematocida minor]KAI5189705.1 hypothetical protein NEMIN01_0658 [Nematocida minor]
MKTKGILSVLLFYANAAHATSIAQSESIDSVLIPFEAGNSQGSTGKGSNNLQSPIGLSNDNAIIPTSVSAYNTGVIQEHNGTEHVCINNSCSEGSMPFVGEQNPNGDPMSPAPGDPFPPIMGRRGRRVPTPVPIGAPFGPQRYTTNPDDPSFGSMPVSANNYQPYAKSAMPFLNPITAMATGFGNGPTRDEALGVLFSIGDEDSYVVLGNVSIKFPLKVLLSSTTMSTDEVIAQDRRDVLMSELEGKGTSRYYDSGLNVLYSSGMYFYIPRTALSLSIEIGKLVVTEEYMKSFSKVNSAKGVFTKVRDNDGTYVYYIDVYGVNIVLPNPETPIVSQVMTTPEGYGFALEKAKRIEIYKGVLILNKLAYEPRDERTVAEELQKFTSGLKKNLFETIRKKFPFEEKTPAEKDDDDDLSSSSYSSASSSSGSKSSPHKHKGKGGDGSSDGSSSGSDSDSGSSSSDSDPSSSSLDNTKGANGSSDSHPRKHKHKHKHHPSSSDGSSSEDKASSVPRVKDTPESLQRKALRMDEKAALAAARKDYKQEKRARRKARKARRKARAMEKEARAGEILKARKAGSDQESAEQDAAAARQASKGGMIEGETTQAGAAWFSADMNKNVAIKTIVESKSETTTASASVFEESSRKAAASSFTANASSAIISAHQAHETYYKGVSSSEYATREIQGSLMGMTMQHALFSTKGRMYQSQKHMAYGVRSSRSSKRWLTRRISKITRMRRAMSRASRRFMQSGATSAGVAAAAAKEQAARSAAIRSSRKAARAQRKAASYKAMAQKAEAQGNKKQARAYRKTATRQTRTYSKHTARAAQFGQAVGQFQQDKLQECTRQSEIIAHQLSNPTESMTEKETIDLNKAVAQILTTSQIQVLSKVLSVAQIRALNSMLTPQQVQQTLIHIGALTPVQMQGILLRLQIKGQELEKMPMQTPMPMPMGFNPMFPAFPLGSPAVANVMSRIQGVPSQMTEGDIIKYLMEGQAMFQSQTISLSPEQISVVNKQPEMIQKLIVQLKAQKETIEASMRKEKFGERMRSSISVCNPMLGLQAGMSRGAFDGISSDAGLQLAGVVSLGNSSFNAIRQLLASPSVASYIGMDQGMLSQALYGQTKNNDLMCLLSKSAMTDPLYQGMPSNEQSLINTRFDMTQNKLYGMYGASLTRLEQALASAYNLIKSSSVRCSGKAPKQPVPTCKIHPMATA